MSTVVKEVTIDSYMVEIIGYILIFLISSLIAIIVWLAKGIVTKVDDLVEKQGELLNTVLTQNSELSAIRGEISDIKTDKNNIFERLRKVEQEAALSAQYIKLKEKDNK